MTNQKAAEMIRNDMKLHHDSLSGEYRKALSMAISALQEQDSKTRSCDTCKHNPPSKKWPCEDCDMRESADRWEPKEAKNSTQEVKKLNGLISRQAAIDAICLNNYHDITLVNGKPYTRGYRDGVLAKENDCIENIMNLPSAQPDCIECLRKIDDYGEEHYIGDNDKMFWDIRSILENPKHSEANHYGESTEIVRGKENR